MLRIINSYQGIRLMSDEVVLTRVGRKYFSRRVIMLTENYGRTYGRTYVLTYLRTYLNYGRTYTHGVQATHNFEPPRVKKIRGSVNHFYLFSTLHCWSGNSGAALHCTGAQLSPIQR